MEEVVLVPLAVHVLDALELDQFGKHNRQERGPLENLEPDGWTIRTDDLLEFFSDSFLADDTNAVGTPGHRIDRRTMYLEVQLGGKSRGPHHPQRVVTERHRRIERRPDEAPVQVGETVERILQGAVVGLIQRDGHRVDREIASSLIVVERAVLDHRFAGVRPVAFAPRRHELEQDALCECPFRRDAYGGRSKTRIDTDGLDPEVIRDGPREIDARPGADRHEVDVARDSAQYEIPDYSTDGIGLDAGLVRHLSDALQEVAQGSAMQSRFEIHSAEQLPGPTN